MDYIPPVLSITVVCLKHFDLNILYKYNSRLCFKQLWGLIGDVR